MLCRKHRKALVEGLEARTLLSGSPQVMGYLVDYKISNSNNVFYEDPNSGKIVKDTLNWNVLTQVNYFALLPHPNTPYNNNPASALTATADGTLQSTSDSGFNPAVQVPAIVSEAHLHGARAYVTLGGGDDNAFYCMDALMNTPGKFATFVTNIKSFVSKYGLDGVDLDWEPTGDVGFKVTKTQIDNFGTLIADLKNAGLKVTAETLAGPSELSNSNGTDAGKTVYTLNATAISKLDAVNVEDYPPDPPTTANQFMTNWKNYLSGTPKDVDGNGVSASASKLQYGLDVSSDDTSNRPAGVVEGKVDAVYSNGYGGLFIYELNSDTTTPSAVTRIGNEIAVKQGASNTGGTISGSVKTSGGAAVANIIVYLDKNNNGTLDNTEPLTVTSSTGAYSFTHVPTGSTVIRQVLQPGDTQTSPSSSAGLSVTLSNGGTYSNKNFVDTVATTGGAAISGSVKSTASAALANVVVYIDKNNDSKLDTGDWAVRTNSSGAYSFAHVPSGSYNIRQVLPLGYRQSTPASNAPIHITVSNTTAQSGKNFVDKVPAEFSGTLIGSSVSLNQAKSGHSASLAFDNNTSTTFEDTQANGNWIGRDLGSAKVITLIKFAADPANPSFMEGGVFQASNSSTFASGVVNLYQVPNTSTPSTSLTSVAINVTTAYRYVRYLPPANSFGDVAEVEFYG